MSNWRLHHDQWGRASWINGIYKITSYAHVADGVDVDSPEKWVAYFLDKDQRNWGTAVIPRAQTRWQPVYMTLEDAKAACEKHAENYTPRMQEVRQAAAATALNFTRYEDKS